jgi:hypothetical protein
MGAGSERQRAVTQGVAALCVEASLRLSGGVFPAVDTRPVRSRAGILAWPRRLLEREASLGIILMLPGMLLLMADVLFWGSLMAAAVLGSFPVALLYSFFVKYYVSGLTAGAVKG